jgi:CHAT domain
MITTPAQGTLTAVLSVAEDLPGGDLTVKLAVRGQGIPGLVRKTATATLDKKAAEALKCDAAAFRGCLNKASTQKDRIAKGKQLSDAVFRGKVARLWARLQSLAAAGHPLRVRLDVQPVGLAALPWELLRGEREWIFLQNSLSAWRGPAPRPVTEDADAGPLRVLVVVCNPKDWRVLADKELAKITGALARQLGRCHVEILDGPSREELSREIDRLRPHVLHLIGHGMPRLPGRDAELTFNWVPQEPAAEGEPPQPWGLNSHAIRYLADWVPRLVVINACRTAGDPVDPVGGFAEAFLAAGARAVVSMQADIDSPTAVQFSAALYKGLSDLDPLDEIVAHARLLLFREAGDTGEWALPLLAARTDPADVLRISFAPTTASISCVSDRQEYARLRGSVDQLTERRNAWWALDPQAEQADSRPVLVVGGRLVDGLRPGKTWLTCWCLFTCFLRGHRVSYVDLAKALRYREPGGDIRQVNSKDWLDVVRVIREACISDRQPEPLSARVFDRFNASLNALVSGQTISGRQAVATPGPVADDWRSFDADRRRGEERTHQVCSEFLTALREASGGRPHVIALDHANSMIAEAFDTVVYPELIRPVAEDKRSAIRLVLVAPDDWLETRLPPADQGLWTSLHLEGFKPDQFMRLARDYCQRRGFNFDDARLERLFEALKEVSMTYQAVPVSVFDTVFIPAAFRVKRP